MTEWWFGDATDAFDEAIRDGVLSIDGTAENFVGHFMYMGSRADGDLFKHIGTRAYVTNPRAAASTSGALP